MNRSASLRRRIASLQNEIAAVEEQLASLDEGHQAHSIIDEYDYNQDGFIEEAEWGGSPNLFETLDTDMDGMLSPAELDMGFGPGFGTTKLASQRAAKHRGLARRKLAHTFFDAYDTNMDGFIDESEWGGSMDAFDALDTNMDGFIDSQEVDLGVGSSFSKLSYGQEEYLTPEEMADLMGGTLISKQASRRRASIGIDKYQALDKIVKAVNGKVLETNEKVPHLKEHINPENALLAILQVGRVFWEIVIVMNSDIIGVTAYLIADEFGVDTINHKFSANKNGWEFELAQLMTTVTRKFMKKNKLPTSYQSDWYEGYKL